MRRLARLSKPQEEQVRRQIRAYESQSIPELVSVPFGSKKLDLSVHPLVANPNIMNSGVVVVSYLLENPHLVKGKVVSDMGTGSGIIGIAAAKLGASLVLMADVDERAVKNAIENVEANKVSGVCRVFQSDLFGNFNPDRRAEVQIFNHPFFSAEPIKGQEWTRMMLGGTDLLGRYLEQAWRYSVPDAVYLLPWLLMAGNEDKTDNDPGKRASSHGFKVTHISEQAPGDKGIQQSCFRIYELQKE